MLSVYSVYYVAVRTLCYRATGWIDGLFTGRDTPLSNISCKCVHFFLSNPTDRQTDRQTNKQDQKHNLPGGVNNIFIQCVFLFLSEINANGI